MCEESKNICGQALWSRSFNCLTGRASWIGLRKSCQAGAGWGKPLVRARAVHPCACGQQTNCAGSGLRSPGRVIQDWRHYLAPRRRPSGSSRWRLGGQFPEPMADNGSIQRKPSPLMVCKQAVAGQRGGFATGHRSSRCPTPSASSRIRCCASPPLAHAGMRCPLPGRRVYKPKGATGGDREPDGEASIACRPMEGRNLVAGSSAR